MKWTMDAIFYPALALNSLLTEAHPNNLELTFRKEGLAILNKMKEGLKHFENEPSSYSPELTKEVRALQNICNGEGIANGNISYLDGANHYLQSDLEGCGKRGLAIVSRHIYSLPFPEAGYYENPSDKTKPEVLPEQPVETQAVVGNKNTAKKLRSKKVLGRALESDLLIIATLTRHHGYENGICNNFEPLRCTELAEKLGLAKSTASLFFKKEFLNYKNYTVICKRGDISTAIKMLNKETAPYLLLGNAADKIKGRPDPDCDI